jgi:hypothetical protein
MNIKDEYEIWYKKITEAREMVDLLVDARSEWSKEKRPLIKKDYPKEYKIYKINIKESGISDIYYNPNCSVCKLSIDEEYFFIPKNTRFSEPDWREIFPTVKGNIVDINRIVRMENEEVSIYSLEEVEYEKAATKTRYNKTFVYVMIDKSTGLYKIGRSNNPQYRERTLQSEKPTIDLMFKFEGMVMDEKVLHDKYAGKRIRGEWFAIGYEEIEEIKMYFTDRTKKEIQL